MVHFGGEQIVGVAHVQIRRGDGAPDEIDVYADRVGALPFRTGLPRGPGRLHIAANDVQGAEVFAHYVAAHLTRATIHHDESNDFVRLTFVAHARR